MTLLQIEQDVFDRIGLGQTPAAADARRIERFVNRWHHRVLTAPGMAALRRVQITQASVNGQATYGLVLNKILWVTETTNNRRLVEKTLAWYRERMPDPSKWTGASDYYVVLGYKPIHTLPSTASELFVGSTVATDTMTVSADVIRATGHRATLSAALTGTTYVSMNTTITDVIDVVSLFISAAPGGNVRLRQTSGTGTELSRFNVSQTRPRFLQYALVPRPTSAITYTFDGIADIIEMADDNDEPLIPADFHDILVDGAVYEEWTVRGRVQDARALLHGGNPARPSDESIQGRIRRLRTDILNWGPDEEGGERTFEEMIKLPIA